MKKRPLKKRAKFLHAVSPTLSLPFAETVWGLLPTEASSHIISFLASDDDLLAFMMVSLDCASLVRPLIRACALTLHYSTGFVHMDDKFCTEDGSKVNMPVFTLVAVAPMGPNLFKTVLASFPFDFARHFFRFKFKLTDRYKHHIQFSRLPDHYASPQSSPGDFDEHDYWIHPTYTLHAVFERWERILQDRDFVHKLQSSEGINKKNHNGRRRPMQRICSKRFKTWDEMVTERCFSVDQEFDVDNPTALFSRADENPYIIWKSNIVADEEEESEFNAYFFRSIVVDNTTSFADLT